MILKTTTKNPIENDYDFFDTDHINELVVHPEYLISSNKKFCINFSYGFDESSQSIYLDGVIDGRKPERVFLSTQKFVDELADALRSSRIPDSMEELVNAKSSILHSFKNNLLDEGFIFDGQEYIAFGYLINSDNKKIGTFESFCLDTERKTMRFLTVQSIINIDYDTSLSFEFILNGHKYTGSIFNYDEDNDLFKYSNFNFDNTDEVYNVQPASDFDNVDDLLANRRELILDRIDECSSDFSDFDNFM